MRLLRRSDAGEVSLTQFCDEAIPLYAILSHTWGADTEEVTFNDLINGTDKDKPGYEKVRFCGEQAALDGLEYFWIDTCCINKSNYAELSQAINSMFHWYRNATRCYVYLSDVTNRCIGDDLHSQRDSDLGRSRWFTRGWTLQELLAPRSIEFFSCERMRIGDRSSLKQQIQQITGIPASALQEARLSQFSIDERFLWMERRQTKLAEDKVYALLGILDVEMPLYYGEGAGNAFKRVREVIDKRESCIQGLRITDPHNDKKRIEDTKGGLLADSYRWILDNSDFQRWRDDKHSRLLWITGDPGKGKTMLLCGIIDELSKSISQTALLSYFFCQATDSRINSATAVLRGLLYMLLQQQPTLISHFQKQYDYSGKKLFEDVNAWVALSEIFTNVLQDPILQDTYFVIDALDECTEGLLKLSNFITQNSSLSPRVKWLVSNRNQPCIKSQLDEAENKVGVCLELNKEHISAAVNIYIKHRFSQLSRKKKYDEKTRDAVLNHLLSNANGTFLWAALACQNLEDIPRGRTRVRLNEFPPGLNSLYERMMKKICESKDSKLYKQILAMIATVYKPITLSELTSFVEALKEFSDDTESVHEIVELCGSFLVVRFGVIYFVHQSAKDYLLTEATNEIFPSGPADIHYQIFSRSLEVLSRTLRRDIYGLGQFGFPLECVRKPVPDPLLTSRYSCIHWVDHLCEWEHESHVNYRDDLQDGGAVDVFIRKKFLNWLEALSCCESMSKGVLAMLKLDNIIQQHNNAFALTELVHDACRFIMYHKQGIEAAPLQVYVSALIFCPTNSLIRRFFQTDELAWINVKPAMESDWSACLQTLESCDSSVAYSHDSSWLASTSVNGTVNIWDANSGAHLRTLWGHSDYVRSVAFSHDSALLISASNDCTIKIWETSSGACLRTLIGHSDWVVSVTFSHDSTLFASASYDRTVKIWDNSGAQLRTLWGHSDYVKSAAFSHDSTLLASASHDYTIKIWETSSGVCLRTLIGHSDRVHSVAFSHDSTLLASGSDDGTVKIWDNSGACLRTLEGHKSTVYSVAFSPDSTLIASSSGDQTVRIWNVTDNFLRLLQHNKSVMSAAFSHDMTRLASVEEQSNIRIWDICGSKFLHRTESHSDVFDSVNFSHDLTQVTSYAITLPVWDATGGKSVATLECHSDSIRSVTFSHDSTLLASASNDCTIKIWETSSGACLRTLIGHSDWVVSVTFSHDSTLLVSASHDYTIKIWETSSGICLRTLQGHSHSVRSVTFSHNSALLASASNDCTIKIWETSSGACLRTLKGYSDGVTLATFSYNSTLLASGSFDGTVRIWEAISGVCLRTLKGHNHWITSVAFSHDSNRLASSSASAGDDTRIWDVSSGECLQTLRIGCSLRSLCFGVTDLYINSNIGKIPLYTPRALEVPPGKVEPLNPGIFGVGLSPDGKWITYNSDNLVWIPPDYQGGCSIISGRMVAIGVGSGRVWICKLGYASSRVLSHL